MPDTWMQALTAFLYPVQLNEYSNALLHPGWFNHNLPTGDRSETIDFENRFRANAANHLSPWLEVVFWKLYSQGGRANEKTKKVEAHFINIGVQPHFLMGVLDSYLHNPSRESITAVRNMFGFSAPVLAVAATFPAFKDPDRHPMVDTRIAKWVNVCRRAHNAIDPEGPKLSQFSYPDNRATVLTMRDFEPMQNWRIWSVHTSRKLRRRTNVRWRARDVDMAVFYAWGGRNGPHFHLNPLPAL